MSHNIQRLVLYESRRPSQLPLGTSSIRYQEKGKREKFLFSPVTTLWIQEQFFLSIAEQHC